MNIQNVFNHPKPRAICNFDLSLRSIVCGFAIVEITRPFFSFTNFNRYQERWNKFVRNLSQYDVYLNLRAVGFGLRPV